MIREKAKKRGKLIDHGVHLMPHEVTTMEFFLARGDDIELVVPSNTIKNKNADWLLWGKIWETKSLSTSNTVIKIIQRKFTMSKCLKHLLIITKNGNVIELKKEAKKG